MNHATQSKMEEKLAVSSRYLGWAGGVRVRGVKGTRWEPGRPARERASGLLIWATHCRFWLSSKLLAWSMRLGSSTCAGTLLCTRE